MNSSTPQIDILLYIALSEEFDALSDELIGEMGKGFTPHELDDLAITIFLGKVTSPVLNQDFRLAIVPAGKMGISRAAAVTSAILSRSRSPSSRSSREEGSTNANWSFVAAAWKSQ